MLDELGFRKVPQYSIDDFLKDIMVTLGGEEITVGGLSAFKTLPQSKGLCYMFKLQQK